MSAIATGKCRFFGEFSKYEERSDGTIVVTGIASSENVDSDGEVIKASAMRAAIPDYLKFGAIREMHQAVAAGTALSIEVSEKGETWLEAHIVDPVAVLKVKNKVYKGFSIGGRVPIGGRNATNPKIIERISLSEISLVDRPANPEAMIQVWKADGLDKADDYHRDEDGRFASGGSPGGREGTHARDGRHAKQSEAEGDGGASNRGTVHDRAARLLGMKPDDARSMSLASLREMVREKDPKLADEISEIIRTGSHIAPGDGKVRADMSWLGKPPTASESAAYEERRARVIAENEKAKPERQSLLDSNPKVRAMASGSSGTRPAIMNRPSYAAQQRAAGMPPKKKSDDPDTTFLASAGDVQKENEMDPNETREQGEYGEQPQGDAPPAEGGEAAAGAAAGGEAPPAAPDAGAAPAKEGEPVAKTSCPQCKGEMTCAKCSGAMKGQMSLDMVKARKERDAAVAAQRAAEEKLAKLSGEVAGADAKIAKLQAIIDSNSQSISKLSSERSDFGVSLDKATLERDSLRDRLAKAQSERDGIEADLLKIRAEHDESEHSLAKVSGDRDAMGERLSKVQAERDNAESELSKLRAAHDIAENTLAKLSSDHAIAADRLVKVQGERDRAETELSKVRAARDAAEAMHEKVSAEKAITDGRLAKALVERDTAISNESRYRVERDTALDKSERVTADRDTLETRFTKMQAEHRALADQLAKANGARDAAEIGATKLKAELDGANERASRLSKALDARDSEVSKLQAAREADQTIIGKMQANETALKKAAARANAERDEASRERDAANAELSRRPKGALKAVPVEKGADMTGETPEKQAEPEDALSAIRKAHKNPTTYQLSPQSKASRP